jgi:TonB family protein
LTQDAIFKVINDNNRSMSLCYGEAARKGEKLRGKMEVQITIDHGGNVTEVSIETAKFSGTTMGDCTMRRVKNWKFPKFSGEAVTVVFPYVLSSSL